MKHPYADIKAAARGLLVESAAIANKVGLEYVVIGGWSSFIRNSGAIEHPGTKDVDLLFQKGGRSGELRDVLEAFLEAGYQSSAKHPFQLLRPLRVDGREFVFNVDFLHHSPDPEVADMFVDHLTLDAGSVKYSYQSIVVPMSSLLFSAHAVASEKITAVAPSGSAQTVEVPLMTEFGTLLTKHRSMYEKKRRRDAFDVMLAIHQAANQPVLRAAVSTVAAQLSGLWGLVEDPRLRTNISQYWKHAEEDSAWAPIRDGLVAFLESASVRRAAK